MEVPLGSDVTDVTTFTPVTRPGRPRSANYNYVADAPADDPTAQNSPESPSSSLGSSASYLR